MSLLSWPDSPYFKVLDGARGKSTLGDDAVQPGIASMTVIKRSLVFYSLSASEDHTRPESIQTRLIRNSYHLQHKGRFCGCFAKFQIGNSGEKRGMAQDPVAVFGASQHFVPCYLPAHARRQPLCTCACNDIGWPGPSLLCQIRSLMPRWTASQSVT